jgi:hypothetical protein
LSADADSGRDLLHDEGHHLDGLQPFVKRHHKNSTKISRQIQPDHR